MNVVDIKLLIQWFYSIFILTVFFLEKERNRTQRIGKVEQFLFFFVGMGTPRSSEKNQDERCSIKQEECFSEQVNLWTNLDVKSPAFYAWWIRKHHANTYIYVTLGWLNIQFHNCYFGWKKFPTVRIRYTTA